MLIDTPDPRYRPDPGADPPWRRANLPAWLWLGGAVACFVLAHFVAPVLAYLLQVAAFCLMLAAADARWLGGQSRRRSDP